MDLHHKLYRRCVRRCFEHEIVAELDWTDLSVLDVFTSKKRRFPWQRKELERQPVSLSEILESATSSEALKELEALKRSEEQQLFAKYTDHVEVNHKGHLAASAKKYAHVNIERDNTFTVDVDFGKLSAALCGAEAFQKAINGLRVQQNHFVLRQRKRKSLYVVVRLNFAEKIVLTRNLHHEVSLDASAEVPKASDCNVGAGGGEDDKSQGALTRDQKSVVSFDCARLEINADNTLTLKDWGVERQGIALDQTDGGSLDLGRPFEAIRSNPDLQDALLAWVQSCPSEETIMLVEELVDIRCSAPEKATGRLMPASWLVQGYKPGSFTETTERILRLLGYVLEVPKDEEPEFAWTVPSDEEERLLTACLNVVSLTEDLSPDQQHALGLVDRSKAQAFIDLFTAAGNAKSPPRQAGAAPSNAWTNFEHDVIPTLTSDESVYAILPPLGLHLGVDSERSGMYDACVMTGAMLKNMAALLYALRTSA